MTEGVKQVRTTKKEKRTRKEKKIHELYNIKGAEVKRNSPHCPRCGEGVFMADKGEWWSCGKCGDRYKKSSSR